MATRKPSGGAPDLAELFRPYANLLPDWSKAMAEMGASTRFWQELMASHQRNLESLTRLNDGVATAMRDIVDKQLALMRTTLAEMNRVGEAMRKPGGAGTALSPDTLAKAFEKALATMREIAGIAEKANREALEAIGERSQAFQHELQAMIQGSVRGPGVGKDD
jgi:phasin family protein